eukprot:gnl/Chilomastix_cuspidata/805.p1 GENE.gnl/Chilomastix_cuspidata/805~~gnl/Chilomastix_cuspidata/805.p1  ORF type:complete len:142 (-),score=5.82 gnl/Chilomastix_cuspidata/805:375-800(-)
MSEHTPQVPLVHVTPGPPDSSRESLSFATMQSIANCHKQHLRKVTRAAKITKSSCSLSPQSSTASLRSSSTALRASVSPPVSNTRFDSSSLHHPTHLCGTPVESGRRRSLKRVERARLLEQALSAENWDEARARELLEQSE